MLGFVFPWGRCWPRLGRHVGGEHLNIVGAHVARFVPMRTRYSRYRALDGEVAGVEIPMV
jgi:hypothetical protein